MSSVVIEALRAKDLLRIQFEFINLTVDSANPSAPRLRRAAAGPAFIVMRFPPQHVAEEASSSSHDNPPPYVAFAACPSRLRIQLPDDISDISLTIEDLLDAVKDLPVLTSPIDGESIPAS